MKNYETLVTEVHDRVLVISINRPDAMNALNSVVFRELDDFFSGGYSNYSFSTVVLTGTGTKAFAAGADIKELNGLSSDQARTLSERGQEIFRKIETFHTPVIAAVNGFALGGGCELAMACHIRIASDNARFGQPEVNLGIIPGYGGTQRLIQLIGKGKATEMLLTGDMITADEALQYGLITHITSPEELIPKALAISGRIASRGPLAVSGVIRSVNAFFESTYPGFAFEAETFGQVAATADFEEGTKAFIEKRQPVFKGK